MPIARPAAGSEHGDAGEDRVSWVSPAVPQSEAGDLTVEHLRGLMEPIYALVRQQRRSVTGALINSKCNIMALDGDEVTLAFAYEAHAAKFRDSGGGHMNVVEDALESLSGRRYRLRVTIDPSVDDWHRAPATARTSHLLDEAEKLGLRREDG